MNVLAFDTCFESCSVAAGSGLPGPGDRCVAKFEPMVMGQAERLVPMIGEVLTAAGLSLAAIDRIAVTRGPGTFTGMRIGVAAARALALARGLPIAGFTSLEVMAMSARLAREVGQAEYAIAVDARRGQVYFQSFKSGRATVGGVVELLGVPEAAERAADRSLVVAGSGAPHIASEAERRGMTVRAVLPDLLPHVEDVLASAAEREPGPHPLTPLYLRLPDAKPQDGKLLARVP